VKLGKKYRMQAMNRALNTIQKQSGYYKECGFKSGVVHDFDQETNSPTPLYAHGDNRG
jgi:hypothetical protein